MSSSPSEWWASRVAATIASCWGLGGCQLAFDYEDFDRPSCTDPQTVLAASPDLRGRNAAADASSIYYLADDDVQSAMFRVSKLGGPAQLLWQGPLGDLGRGLAVDDRVYFTASGSVFGVPKGGGDVQHAFPDVRVCHSVGVAMVPAHLFFASCGPGGGVAAVSRETGMVVQAWSTGAPISLVAHDGGAVLLAVDSTRTSLVRLDPAGSEQVAFATLEELATEGQRLAVHDGRAYVAMSSSIVVVPLAGGEPTDIISRIDEPRGIAVDDSGIYVSVRGTGTSDPRVLRFREGDRVGTVMAVLGDSPAFNPGLGAEPLMLDETSIYWGAQGEIGRVGKCTR